MTIINTFAIGAGGSIASQIDDERDKSRREAKRLNDKAHFADKERLNARLRKMNEQAALVTADRLSDVVQEQQTDTKTKVFDRRSPMPFPFHKDTEQAPHEFDRQPPIPLSFHKDTTQASQEFDRRSAISLPFHKDTKQASQAPQAPLDTEAKSAARAEFLDNTAQANRPGSWRSDQVMNPMKVISSQPVVNDIEIVNGAATESIGSDNRPRTTGAPDLLSRLLDGINGSPASLTREEVMPVLERLSHDLYEKSPGEVTTKERESVLGYLEFLEGYFEKGETSAGPSPQLAALMNDIRVQLSAVSAPIQLTEIQKLLIADQPDNQPIVQVFNREQRKKQLKSSDVGSEEARRSGLDAYASIPVIDPIEARKSTALNKESSLTKDSERRRDETLVSVTLRSV